MSMMFGYAREAIRVKVKKCEGSQPADFRKFSVDPQITSFEVLQSILAKAFDLKGDFAICYRIYDVNGHETYLPLLSDWDLDAAFLKAYNTSVVNSLEPCLCLRVDLKPFEESSDDWELKRNVSVITQIRTPTCQEAKPSPRLHGIFNQMGKTLNMVQRALNFGEDISVSLQPPRAPLSDSEFRTFLDPVGQIIHAKELRSVIYFGGIEPSLRKVVWKHLLNVYPDGMTGRERMDYIKRKAQEYISLREVWKSAVAQGNVGGELAYTTGMVRKDVLRTDRHHPFYAGSDDNQNIASLFNILTTYALNHPKVSYCQGMSDLASPLLVTMNDEAHAYICFCALMQRLCINFMIDGIAMTQKFTHLAEGLMYYDPEFYNYLKSHQADDLLFCYRWLLLEMKREFAFDDSLRMLEVLWSSLPSDPPVTELKLYDVQFQSTKTATPPISPLVKTPRESAYTKVCALRRQSSSMSIVNLASKPVKAVKRQIHSLDETVSRGRNHVLDAKTKHQSLDDAALTRKKMSNDSTPRSAAELSTTSRPRSVSPLEPKSDSVVLNNRINSVKNTALSSSMNNLIKSPGVAAKKSSGTHFRELKERIAAAKLFSSSLERLDHSIQEEDGDVKPSGKLVKNLNEFLNFTKEKPTILLTKSSVDNSESSSLPTSNCGDEADDDDDTFDEYSPDDSQEYCPLTTSVTRELRLELENLDRTVFGEKFPDKLSESPPSTECSSDIKTDDMAVKTPELIPTKEDVFVWENPLLTKSNSHTPDEQADIEYDKAASAASIVAPSAADCNGLTNSCEEASEQKISAILPPPNEFGGGNPFLMFLCITVLLQHRQQIISQSLDYNEMAMHFDKMVRKHNVTRVLNQARQMYARYIKQHTLSQQKQDISKDC